MTISFAMILSRGCTSEVRLTRFSKRTVISFILCLLLSSTERSRAEVVEKNECRKNRKSANIDFLASSESLGFKLKWWRKGCNISEGFCAAMKRRLHEVIGATWSFQFNGLCVQKSMEYNSPEAL
ncbi:hypothetical protein FB451DRAFT_1306015 [Mycena latifolia]|nr:hypothetical protein FB451DRAFT_1306015 [Mycena latifolia]